MIQVAHEVVQSSASGSSLYSLASNSTVMVLGPLNPTLPITKLDAPSTIGVCSNLFLDGSRTTGSGGRALRYNFSTSNENAYNVTQSEYYEMDESLFHAPQHRSAILF